MLGSIAIGTMVVAEIGLTVYSLNKIGALDPIKDKAKEFSDKLKAKLHRAEVDENGNIILEADIVNAKGFGDE